MKGPLGQVQFWDHMHVNLKGHIPSLRHRATHSLAGTDAGFLNVFLPV